MTPQTPYSQDLGDREPVGAMREATERMRTLAAAWSPAEFERSYAPGKWSARQIFIHLAQSELAFGNRARMALATPNYTAQPFDQDRWMAREETGGATGREALAAVLAANALNRALFGSLSPDDRATPFTHPEYGTITVDW